MLQNFRVLDNNNKKIFLLQVIIEGRNHGHDLNYYQQYMNHLWQEHENSDPIKQYAKVSQVHVIFRSAIYNTSPATWIFRVLRTTCSPRFNL